LDSCKINTILPYKEFLALSKLTTLKLESYIKKAMNCLGDISYLDRLHYVSSMLLYKRLNDVFVETATQIEFEEQSNHGWEDKDEHPYFLPKNARWSTIVTAPISDLGQNINNAFDILEESNTYLRGLFTSVDFNDRSKMPSTKILEFVQIFSELELMNKNLLSTSILGISFIKVVQSMSENFKRPFSSTPSELNSLMVKLIQPIEGMRICDPTVGIGNSLIELSNYMEGIGERLENVTLHGQEADFSTWALCKRNLLLHDIVDTKVEHGDTLRSPRLVQNNHLIKYDRIVSIPPFGKTNWGREVSLSDSYDRFNWGIPPDNSGDYAFLQHIISTLKDNGKASIVIPVGVLLRGGIEGEIRKALIDADLIETVIVLPTNLIPDTTLQTCVLMVNKAKSKDIKGTILFIDGSKDFQPKGSNNKLRHQDIAKILSSYKDRENIPGYSRVASIDQVKEEGYSLVPNRYIRNYNENVVEIFKHLKVTSNTLDEIADEVRLYTGTENMQEGDSNNSKNSIFYPLNLRIKPVLLSLTNKNGMEENENYAEIVLNIEKADASYIFQFLNSQIGRRLRILLHENFAHDSLSLLTLQDLKKLCIYVPKVNEQIQILQLQSKIRNTTTALLTLEQKVWGTPDDLKSVKSKMEHLVRGDNLDNWYESLPYPLASILLLYARDHDPGAKVQHLFNFFEAFSQFLVVLLLSHFFKEQMVLEEVIKRIKEKGYRIRIRNSTFGSWVSFGLKLAKEGAIEPSFQDLYNYNENAFLKMITDVSIFELLMEATSMRNRWKGHGGIDNNEISRQRLVFLEDILSKLNARIGNNFEQITFLSPLDNRFRSGEYFFTIQNLAGSNPHFKVEKVITSEVMDEGKLYLLHQGDKQPLELAPFFTICMEKKACHYYSALVKENNKEVVRFVSYHYDKEPEKFEESPDLQAFINENLL
jgi:type I restriction enzyme M protein